MSDNQSGIQINLPLDEITAFCERWKIWSLLCSGLFCETILAQIAILMYW